MSSRSAGSSAGTWSRVAWMTPATKSSGRTSTSEPRPARPIGVRAAATITASGTRESLGRVRRLAAGQPDGDPGQEQLDQRADRHRVEHGAHADGAAQQEPDAEHRELDAGADQPDAGSGAGGQAGHQTVAG